MRLIPLDLKTAQKARKWRESCPESLRTERPITEAQQEAWFERISHDPCERWWGIEEEARRLDFLDVERAKKSVIGYCGIEHIQWSSGHGEISILIDPRARGRQLGTLAVGLLLREAFETLHLHMVYGETYACSLAFGFWKKLVESYGGYTAVMPSRKYWSGNYFPALYFSIDVENWREREARDVHQ